MKLPKKQTKARKKSICQGVGWRRTLDDMQGEVQLTQCTKTRRPSLAGLGDITLWKKNNFRFSFFFLFTCSEDN